MTKSKSTNRTVKNLGGSSGCDTSLQRNGSGKPSSAPPSSLQQQKTDGPSQGSRSAKTLGKKPRPKSSITFGRNTIIGAILLALLAVGSYIVYVYLQEQKTLSPFPGPLIPYDRSYTNSLLWGTYRPGVYFGVRSRTPHSLEMGLMWFSYSATQFVLRHLCDQNDRLRYGWKEHDGRSFGYQEISEENVDITTTFVKRFNDQKNDWISRISVVPTTDVPAVKAKTGLFVYFRLEDKGKLAPIIVDGSLVGLEGSTPTLGSFKVHFAHQDLGKSETVNQHSSFLTAQLASVTKLRDTILAGVTMTAGSTLKLVGQTTNEPNLIVYELAVVPKFTLDITYEPLKADMSSNAVAAPLESPAVDELILRRKQKFREKFQSVFRLLEKGYGDAENDFAQRIFSNLIGGIGYFYGESLVTSRWSSSPAKYWTSGLFSAVPSRSFFPRGFLWDEGFHHLVISRWDIGLTREVMSSWFNLMNAEGWIAREQILGEEARSRVPDEFIVQNSEYGNPPSFFLTIEAMLDGLDPDRPDEVDKTLKFFEFAFPRMHAWYNWFNTTQLGSVPGSYRWRGRNETTDREVNPKTLTSGLDDYPRASHPGAEERHVDLYCWMAYGAGILARVAEEVGENPAPYRSTEMFLKNNAHLDKLHWSEGLGFYADFGRHTDAVRLERLQPTRPPRAGQPVVQTPKIRVVDQEPKVEFVNALGYVSLFPLMLRILEPSSPRLGELLARIRDPLLLWTDYGIRSLAKNSPLFSKHNTEHDGPYWRGAVWINMNYLILKALKFYGELAGPFQQRSQLIAQELKSNVFRNMFRQYQKTGHVWEQYVNEEGRGSHPFTGWSSLVVLMMADF